MKQHIIITSSNERYGDFVVNHWLKSLKENSRLDKIDLAVIDYGLNPPQTKALKKGKLKLVKGTKDGHIVTTRFVDAGRFLKSTKYDQVLFIDGGDIIFQGDISHLFEQDKDLFRVVKIDMEVMFFEAFIPKNFTSPLKQELWNVLKNKPVLNAGLIFAPRGRFIYLCDQVTNLVSSRYKYGPDQIIVNFVLHQDKVKLLNNKYNFMLGTESKGFVIRDGAFYKKDGEKIVVVHNAGHDSFLRPIDNFGYGSEYNQLKHGIYYGRKIAFNALGLARKLHRLVKGFVIISLLATFPLFSNRNILESLDRFG